MALGVDGAAGEDSGEKRTNPSWFAALQKKTLTFFTSNSDAMLSALIIGNIYSCIMP